MESSRAMRGKLIERRLMKSWHGAEIEISVYENHWARVGFLTHPQIANFFMRYGLPRKMRGELELLHEFGHVQMFPLVFIYYLPFLFKISEWFEFAIITAGMLIFWEILAEIYVVGKYRWYFEVYKKNLHSLTVFFWIAVILVSAVPFFVV